MSNRARLLAMVASFLPLVAAAPACGAPTIPAQWIAKIYTEALGRAPDQGGWKSMVAYFQGHGCGATGLAAQGEPVYDSAEFGGLGYDDAARLLTLYRGVLNREPDQAGFSANLGALSGGTAWPAMVHQFFTSAEFDSLVASICTAGSYSFGTGPAIAIPLGRTCSAPSACFNGGTQAQLQALLNATPPGGTVYLGERVVVAITTSSNLDGRPVGLVVPPGVTLTTYGRPATGQYAMMGRLVRTRALSAAVVEVLPGARLLDVWVDGQRGIPLDYVRDAVNVEAVGGAGAAVANDRISNAAGWSSMHAWGSYQNVPCSGYTISGNVVTVYSSSHSNGLWTDGLSVACASSVVSGNQVVDATDVGIVLFEAAPLVQTSEVSGNVVLSAGNPSFGGIDADPLFGSGSTRSFAGSSIDHNTLWTSPNTYFCIALAVGTRPWFPNPDMGTGASFTSNTTGALAAWVTEGVAVSGMTNAVVQGNTLTVNVGHHCGCPQAAIAAAVSAGWASGSIQGPYVDTDVHTCV
jgi:hypothetical protein